MEKDNKGKEKRRIDSQSDDGRSKKARRQKPDATEAEVEEFFAILRRMQVAAKYFEKGNGGGWRAAVESEVLAVVGRDCGGEDKEEENKIKKGTTSEKTGVLDLNAMPEMEPNEI